MEPLPLEKDYTIMETLHKTEVTTVNKVRRKFDGEIFVSKFVWKTKENSLPLARETAILDLIKHCNIIKLDKWDQNDYYVFMIFEQMDEDLFSFIDRIVVVPEEQAIPIIKQILAGVDFLHKNNILHRDLKVENILCENLKDGSTQIRIADFGFSIVTDQPVCHSLGTPAYAAPEIYNSFYTTPVDVWAVGIICYIMLIGDFPFYSDHQNVLEWKIFYSKVPWPEKGNVSQTAKDFIEALLEKDQSKRITIKGALAHPWMN